MLSFLIPDNLCEAEEHPTQRVCGVGFLVEDLLRVLELEQEVEDANVLRGRRG